jgi:hypothetical protein
VLALIPRVGFWKFLGRRMVREKNSPGAWDELSPIGVLQRGIRRYERLVQPLVVD